MFIINSFHIRKVSLTKAFINVNHYILIIVRILIECFKSMSAFVINWEDYEKFIKVCILVIILKNSEHIVHVCSKKLPSNELKKSLKIF